jgi:hypothetical protein
MSWLSKALNSPFPSTSDIWWTVTTGFGFLFLLSFAIGESLWGAGVKNFTAYTWFIRYNVSRPVLIALVVIFAVAAAFLVWHFGWGKGWKTGPNV